MKQYITYDPLKRNQTRILQKCHNFGLVALAFTILFILLGQPAVVGQYFAEEHWHEGRVELTDGQVHRGQLRYQLQENMVQFKSEELVRNFNSAQVEYFQFYDEAQDSIRHFYALEYDQRMQFFELILNGTLTLLNRQELIIRYLNGFGRFGTTMQTISEVNNNFFILFPDSDVRKLPTSKRAFVDELPRYRNQTDDFIRRYRIRLRQTEDLLRTVYFYNRLHE